MPNDLKDTILKTSIKFGNETDWFALYDRVVNNSNSNTETLNYLRALAYTQNYELLKFLLLKSSDRSFVRGQDEASLLGYIAKNPIGKALFFEYMNDNWQALFERLGQMFFSINDLISDAFTHYNSPADLRKLESFMDRNKGYLGVAESQFKETLEQVNANIQWMNENFEYISVWLKKEIQ
jgi:hypothetical protein